MFRIFKIRHRIFDGDNTILLCLIKIIRTERNDRTWMTTLNRVCHAESSYWYKRNKLTIITHGFSLPVYRWIIRLHRWIATSKTVSTDKTAVFIWFLMIRSSYRCHNMEITNDVFDNRFSIFFWQSNRSGNQLQPNYWPCWWIAERTLIPVWTTPTSCGSASVKGHVSIIIKQTFAHAHLIFL